jgi:hypothetical protein
MYTHLHWTSQVRPQRRLRTTFRDCLRVPCLATSAEAAGAGRRASEENTDQGAHHGADTRGDHSTIPPLFSLSAAAVFSAGDGGVVVVALYPERPRTYFELSPPPAKGQASIVLCSGMRLLGITLAELGPSDSERRLLFWSPLSRIPIVSLGALQHAGKRGTLAPLVGGESVSDFKRLPR